MKRASYGDASLSQKVYDRNSKQKISAPLTTPSVTLYREQGSSKSNGGVRGAAAQDGNVQLAGISPLFLGMLASDVAALPEPTNLVRSEFVRSWFDLTTIVRWPKISTFHPVGSIFE